MNTVTRSSDLAFEDFLRKVRPWRADMERAPMPASELYARMYQQDTDALCLALRSGDRVRLEAAVFGVTR